MMHLETLLKPSTQHFSPPICTFSHCIRELIAGSESETNSFNEINNLEKNVKEVRRFKVVLN